MLSFQGSTCLMGRLTRRRFLATASTVAGSLSLGKRLGWAKPAAPEPDNLRLWYNSPASEWVDALPIGNGRLGAMVFGGGATNNRSKDRIDRRLSPILRKKRCS